MRDDAANRDAGFHSALVDRMRRSGNVWPLPGGQLVLPEVFGFCRGVERALTMLERAVDEKAGGGKGLFLLGEIIHNPWVNQHFQERGVRLLSQDDLAELEQHIRPGDCVIIPAFGVTPQIEQRLAEIGCEVVDTSCGDVRRLWIWAERAVREGYAVLIYGRASHDETVVTKSRLAEAGGKYLVVGSMKHARQLCELIRQGKDDIAPATVFGQEATNADSLAPFGRLAQVSQTTMLYDETIELRQLLGQAFAERFGPAEAKQRLRFQPTVCRATQQRQNAAVELCSSDCDLVVVVGGFGSSNTRHLHELARRYCPAYFIESAEGLRSQDEIICWDPEGGAARQVRDWLPKRRPLRIAVLAGASCPETVIGQVLLRLAELLEASPA